MRSRIFATSKKCFAGLNAVWVGGTDVVTEGEWLWVPSDDPIPAPSDPGSHWGDGEPNNGDCLTYVEGQWDDRSCGFSYPSVCVIDRTASPTLDG